MAVSSWSLQQARNHFSAVVDAASNGKPQVVTKRGKPAVVVVAAAEYARLRQRASLDAPTFVDHLLAMPTDGRAFERPSTVRRAANR